MSARLLALCCLLILAVSPGRSGGDPSSRPDVVVYLKTTPAQPAAPVEAMKPELNELMRRAGLRVEWRDVGSANRNVEDAVLVVVELRGVCGVAGEPAGGRADPGSLASTAVSGGRVLPFSWLNCDVLNRMVAPASAGLYGRAMARVAAHELCHVLAQSREHGRAGLAKAAFSRRELLGDSFDFAEGALARLAQSKSRRTHDQVLLLVPSNRSF